MADRAAFNAKAGSASIGKGLWRAAAGAALAAGLAACASDGPPAPISTGGPVGPSSIPQGPGSVPPPVGKPGLTPPFLAGQDITRVGILLPFGARQQDAEALYNAAELALFDYGAANVLLIPRDSGTTSNESEAAARALVRDGADIILGPLLRETVPGASQGARSGRIPMVAFSTDKTVAGGGTYLLSVTAEEEVARVVDFAVKKGLRSIALIAPENQYGRVVEAALRAEAGRRGASVPVAQFYPPGAQNAAATARAAAPAINAAGAQALMIADGGASLRAIGPALLQGGLNLQRIQLLGTGQWGATADTFREPTLARGWYAAPEPAGRGGFEARYRAAHGRSPPRIASLSYDAMALAALMTRDQGRAGINRGAVERTDGYTGTDGIFRFRPDGTVERALAILEVRSAGPGVLDPAPKRFPAAGS